MLGIGTGGDRVADRLPAAVSASSGRERRQPPQQAGDEFQPCDARRVVGARLGGGGELPVEGLGVGEGFAECEQGALEVRSGTQLVRAAEGETSVIDLSHQLTDVPVTALPKPRNQLSGR
jgi:hypothetical protein